MHIFHEWVLYIDVYGSAGYQMELYRPFPRPRFAPPREEADPARFAGGLEVEERFLCPEA